MNFNDALDCLCSLSLRCDLSDATLRRLASDTLAEFKLDDHWQPEQLVAAYDSLTPRAFAAAVRSWEKHR